MDVSELEQSLAIKNDQAVHLQQLCAPPRWCETHDSCTTRRLNIIDDPTYVAHDKTKLALLYQLRYETAKDVRSRTRV